MIGLSHWVLDTVPVRYALVGSALVQLHECLQMNDHLHLAPSSGVALPASSSLVFCFDLLCVVKGTPPIPIALSFRHIFAAFAVSVPRLLF
jgi:hypothetical protein